MKMICRLATWLVVLALPALSSAQWNQPLGTSMSGPNPWIDVTTYGAKGDAQVSTEILRADTCSVGVGLAIVDCGTAAIFSPSDQGKYIEVPKGALGGGTFLSQIDRVDPSNTKVTMHSNMTALVATGSVPITWGTDNYTPIKNAIAACPSKGCVLYFPHGDYMFGASDNTSGTNSAITMLGQKSFEIVGQGDAERLQDAPPPTAPFSPQAGVRLLTAMPIVIMTLGSSGQDNSAGFQLWNLAFIDTTSIGMSAGATIGGNSLGGLHIISSSVALIGQSDFEHFNAAGSYGIQSDPGSCSTGSVNNLFLLNDRGQDNSTWFDGTPCSGGHQDGPIMIGGDVFVSTFFDNLALQCYGVNSGGPIRIFGAHFDVGTVGSSAHKCIGVKAVGGQVYGKFEASGSGGTGIGQGVEVAGSGLEVDGVFNNEAPGVAIDNGVADSRIVVLVGANANSPDVTDGSNNNTNTIEIHGKPAAGNTFQFGGPLAPTKEAAFDLGNITGTTPLPWKNLFLAGTSSSPSVNNFLITGASTSGTRTITLPNVTDTLAGLTAAQAFTNKTYTSPIIGSTITSYNSIGTVSNGVPAEYATVDLVNQSAAIPATTLYAVPASHAGMYRISWVATVTTAASTSSTLGGTGAGFQVQYTDNDDSITKLSPIPGAPAAGANQSFAQINQGNTTATQISGVIIVNAKASTSIQYKIGYTSSPATSMQYNLHIKCEAL